MFAIRNFVLFALRYSIFGIICYSLCVRYLVLHAQIIRITNNKYSITTAFLKKYFEFHKPFANFIFIRPGTMFYSQSVQKVAKWQIPVGFYRFVCLYCLRQEIITSFWKTMLPIIWFTKNFKK